MRHARKYVVGIKGRDWLVGEDATESIVAAWKCVVAKDGTRRMVRVSKRA